MCEAATFALVGGTLAVITWGGATARPDASRWLPTMAIIALGFGVFILAWLTSRLLPQKLPPLRPVSADRGRVRMAFGGGLNAAFALLPILPALWIARDVAASSVQLASVPAGTAVVAETPDHAFLAIGGSDGGVQVYERKNGHIDPKPLWTSPDKVEGFSDRLRASGEHVWVRSRTKFPTTKKRIVHDAAFKREAVRNLATGGRTVEGGCRQSWHRPVDVEQVEDEIGSCRADGWAARRCRKRTEAFASRELNFLRAERDLLKKATVFFAKETSR